MMKFWFAMVLCMTCSFAQKQNTTPVPILKQINRHNEDGSYSYGYEAADGSYKIETKSAKGEVKGKYGYVDTDGNLREISYGANQYGYQPQGTDINVPPPTIHAENNNQYPSVKAGEIDDGQYREDPNIYLDPKYNSKSTGNKPTSTFRIQTQQPAAKSFTPAHNFNYQTTSAQVYEQSQVPQSYESRFQAEPQNFYRPQQKFYQLQNNHQTRNNFDSQTPVNIFEGHPASNFDIYSGSYSISY